MSSRLYHIFTPLKCVQVHSECTNGLNILYHHQIYFIINKTDEETEITKIHYKKPEQIHQITVLPYIHVDLHQYPPPLNLELSH